MKVSTFSLGSWVSTITLIGWLDVDEICLKEPQNPEQEKITVLASLIVFPKLPLSAKGLIQILKWMSPFLKFSMVTRIYIIVADTGKEGNSGFTRSQEDSGNQGSLATFKTTPRGLFCGTSFVCTWINLCSLAYQHEITRPRYRNSAVFYSLNFSFIRSNVNPIAFRMAKTILSAVGLKVLGQVVNYRIILLMLRYAFYTKRLKTAIYYVSFAT